MKQSHRLSNMIAATKIEAKIVDGKFSDAYSGGVRATEVYVNNSLFCNAVERVNDEGGRFQLIVCDGCGITGCASGGWAVVRQSNELVLFIPSWVNDKSESMTSEEREIMAESSKLIMYHGMVIFTHSQYMQLTGLIDVLPEISQIPMLSCYEAVCVFQAQAPCNVLNKFPAPIEFNKNLYLASDLENVDVIELIDTTCYSLATSPHPALLNATHENPISIYLDNSQFTEWQALYSIGNQYFIRLAPNYYVSFSQPQDGVKY